jgi:hypothetical protein
MTRYFFAIIVAVILIISLAQTSHAVGLYSKPEFRGRVIDAETKQPVEGSVVVVLYYKQSTISIDPGGFSPYVFKAKETLTDTKGEFFFSSYSSVLLFTEDAGVDFIFYKPGYMADYGPTNVVSWEKYFSSDVIGKEGEIHAKQGTPASYKGPLGIVELKKGERDPSTPSNYRSTELPLLFKALNEDRRNRGYKGELK